MEIQFKKKFVTRAVPLVGTGLFLLSTNTFAVECAPICTVTGPNPEINLINTTAGEGSWEIEAVTNSFGISPEGTTNGQDHFKIEPGTVPNQLVLDSTDNIGIKTNSPGADIEIQDALPEIRFDDSSSGGLQMDIGVNQTFMHIEGNGSQDIVHIDANAPSNSIYIQPSGDVGIGTSSPDFAMHVRRANGTAQVKISEGQATSAVKTLFSLECLTCTPGFRFASGGLSQIWFFRMLQNGSFSVDDPVTPAKEVEFKSGGNMTIGGLLTQGSSREIKHNIVPVDTMDVLAKLEQLEIARWTYNHNKDNVVHMGPMAEDFHATFNLGDNDKGISSVDTAGVSLAAIKALNSERKRTQQSLESIQQSLIEKDKKIAELQARIIDMGAKVAEVQNLKEMLVQYIEQDNSTKFSHVSF